MKRLWLWLLCCPLSLLAEPTEQIFILHSYSQDYAWTQGQHRGFVQALRQRHPGPLLIESEYLDTKRVAFEPRYRALFLGYLREKYRNFSPRALYVTDDDGLVFGLKELSQLFPNTPLFFSGVNDYGVQQRLDPKRHSGVFEKKEPLPNLRLIQELFGDFSRLLVVGDGSSSYRAIETELRHELAQQPQLEVQFIGQDKLEQLLAALQQAPGVPLLLTTIGAMRDQDGALLPLAETLRRITAVGPRPVISMEDAYIQQGVVGGFVTSGPAQGAAAAELVAASLQGKALEELPAQLQSPNHYIFDDQVLRTLGLRLPGQIARQAQLLHSQPGLYQRFRVPILAALILLSAAFLLTLVFYLLRVTEGNRRLRQQAQLLEQQGTALEEQGGRLRQQSSYLNSILAASSNVGLIATDLQLQITYFNAAAERIFGQRPGEMAGKDIFFFHGGRSGEVCNQRLQGALDQAQQSGEYRFSLKLPLSAGTCYIDARISPVRDENGRLIGYLLMAEDVSRQHEAEQLIKYQAAYDALTNLPNRRSLLDRLGQLLANCRRHGHYGALFFLDLDNFKLINDTLGHQAGDQLLQQVAERMRRVVRSEDSVGRLGGDEFLVLAGELADGEQQALQDAQVIADNLLSALTAPLTLEGQPLRPTCSIGVALFPLSELDTQDELLRRADRAMYQAKQAGRNRYHFADGDL